MHKDTGTTDHLQGNVIYHIDVLKQADGTYKASGQGQESINRDQARAVTDLQAKLQQLLLTGDLIPQGV